MGIFIGLYLVKLFKLEEYDWFGRKNKKSIKDWDLFKWYIIYSINSKS